jgi:hypothetical protein
MQQKRSSYFLRSHPTSQGRLERFEIQEAQQKEAVEDFPVLNGLILSMVVDSDL